MPVLRITAAYPFALSVVSFSLTLVLLLAGSRPGYLDENFVVSLNASKVGRDIIRFEPVSSTSATSTAGPLDFLNPLSTSSPLNPNNPDNPFSGLLGPLIDSMTGTIDNGLQTGLNVIVETLIKSAGVRDFYNLYVETICEGNATNKTGKGDEVNITRCSSYNDEQAGINYLTHNLRSSVVIGTTNISVPLISSLQSSLSSLSDTSAVLRKTTIAFLIIAMHGSAFTFLFSIPAIFFPQSKLLVYTLVFNSTLGSVFQFLSAVILTAMMVTAATTVNLFGEAVGLHATLGDRVLLFVWVGWVFVALAWAYWFAVWFVEVRTWSFVRRSRSGDGKGNWKGAVKEVWRDFRGQKGGEKG